MKKRNPRENGQVIILLVAGIISLLGFTALAIDGARLYSERRHAQGTADTAVLTMLTYVGQYTATELRNSTIWNAVDDDAEQAALERIYDNGYDDYAVYNSFTSNDRLRMDVIQTTGPYFDTYTAKVFLISEVDPVFAQLITDEELLVNVESEAVLKLYTNLGFGQALYSLSDDACNAIDFSGTSDIQILGSGIYANSSCDPAVNVTGTTGVTIDDDVTTPGGYDNDGGGVLTTGGTINTGADPHPTIPVPEPDCSVLSAGNVVVDNSGAVTKVIYYPGVYNSKIVINSGFNEQIFLPGLYCLNAGMSVGNGNVTAHDVTFYVPTDNVSIGGSPGTAPEFSFIAPRAGQADDGTNSWDGMLFYVADGKLDITGGENTYLEGTIYAPSDQFNPTCKLTGNGNTVGYNLQFVCDTIGLGGTSETLIEYDGTNAYLPPIAIDLVE
jgi:hypothetical protein